MQRVPLPSGDVEGGSGVEAGPDVSPDDQTDFYPRPVGKMTSLYPRPENAVAVPALLPAPPAIRPGRSRPRGLGNFTLMFVGVVMILGMVLFALLYKG